MQDNNKRLAAIVAGALVLVLAAFWYWSPYWDMRQVAAAAEAKDADAFNEYVDYPRLRESLRGQFSAKMAAALPKGSDNPFAGLGAMIGMGFVNQMVDAMVRPEFVMKAMQEGKMVSPAAPGRASSPESGTTSAKEPTWEFDRKGANKVIAYLVDPENPGAKSQRAGFVFERNGFADWKLTELRLPDAP